MLVLVDGNVYMLSLIHIFKADPRIGNDKELSNRIVLFDENMMSEIMNGFPNLQWVSVEAVSYTHLAAAYSQTGSTAGVF